MEVKERIIDLRQYFLYLWENIIIIAVVSILFAGGFAGYNYKKQKELINATSSVDRSILNSIISQNHDAFYSQNTNAPSPFTDAQPPANTYNSSARLFVDFNFSIIEGNTNLDFAQMSKQLQQDASLLLVSDEALNSVIEKLDLHQYDDMSDITPDDLKWLVNRNFLGANIMQVVVTDVDADRAKQIAEAVVDEFIAHSDDISTIDSVEIIDNASTPKRGLNTSLQTSVDKKRLLKYAIVGFVGGLFIICVLYLMIFIFNDAVRNSLDVAFADMSVFGSVSRNENKKKEDIKRIAYNISLLKDIKKVVIVPTDKKAEKDDFVDQISTELANVKSDIKLERVENIKDSADATMVATRCDAILILVRYGKTRMKDLLFAKGEMDKTGTRIIGTIIRG